MGALVTRKGDPYKPPAIMIYGPEGMGKSTFGARAESPVFIAPEGGTSQLRTKDGAQVDEIPGIKDWAQLRAAIKSVLNDQHNFKTLVIDSADWVEKLAHAAVIGKSDKDIIRAGGGYGAGYRQSEAMHRDLISDLTDIVEKRRMNVIVTAHAHVKPVKDPSVGLDYDGHEIKCHEYVSSLWREWVDALLFVRLETLIAPKSDDQEARAVSSGKHIVYTKKDAAIQAKNRYDLPPKMEFTRDFWDGFINHVRTYSQIKAAQKPMTFEELAIATNDLWVQLPEGDIKAKVKETVIAAGQDFVKLKQIHDRLVELKNKKEAA